MEEGIIVLTVLVVGFIAYKWGYMRANSKKTVNTSKGKVIVVDNTKPDTSKEDAIKDKFGDLK